MSETMTRWMIDFKHVADEEDATYIAEEGATHEDVKRWVALLVPIYCGLDEYDVHDVCEFGRCGAVDRLEWELPGLDVVARLSTLYIVDVPRPSPEEKERLRWNALTEAEKNTEAGSLYGWRTHTYDELVAAGRIRQEG